MLKKNDPPPSNYKNTLLRRDNKKKDFSVDCKANEMKKAGTFQAYIKTSALLGDYVKNAFDEAIFRTYAAKNPGETQEVMNDWEEETQEDNEISVED